MAPATGFSCACSAGYEADGTTCVDVDACAEGPCDDGGDVSATCTDDAAPSLGYTCGCGAAYVWNGATCINKDECLGNPCDDGGVT